MWNFIRVYLKSETPTGLTQFQHPVQPSLFCCTLVEITPCKSTSQKHRLAHAWTQRHTGTAQPYLDHVLPPWPPCLLPPKAQYALRTHNAWIRQVPGDNTLMLSHSAAHGQGSAQARQGLVHLYQHTKTISTLHAQGQSCKPNQATSLGQQSHCQESTTVYLRAWHPPKPSTLGCCLTWASRGGWGASLPREPPKLSPDYSGF